MRLSFLLERLTSMNIVDRDELFRNFADNIEEREYIVIVCARKFEISPNEELSLNFLGEVFASKGDSGCIEGTLEECTFEDAVSDINKCLAYKHGMLDLDLWDEEEQKKRQHVFWGIIKNPPEKTYEHVAFHRSMLSYGVYWNFCYIFINCYEGFAIAMGASD